MKVAACLGVVAALGYLALAPTPGGARAEETPRPARGAYRHAPLGVAPGHRMYRAVEGGGGGGFVAPPVETVDPNLLL
jgi:hypothetical protein